MDAESPPPFCLEIFSLQSREYGNCFWAVLRGDGIYEITYMHMDGSIFHRSIAPLSRESVKPWPDEPEEQIAFLPDVIMRE